MKSLFPLEILWFSFILSLRAYGIPGPCSWQASRKPRSVSFLLPVVHAKDAWVSQLSVMLLAHASGPGGYPSHWDEHNSIFHAFLVYPEYKPKQIQLSAPPIKRLLRLQNQTLKIGKKQYYSWQKNIDLLSLCTYYVCKVTGCLPYWCTG